MRHPQMRPVSGGAAAACSAVLVAALAGVAEAQKSSPAPPDDVRLPRTLNLGFTSYFDAVVSTKPGLTVIGYYRREQLDEITGPDGRASPAFNHPRIDVDIFVLQLVYVAHEVRGGALGLNLAQPLVNLDSKFATPGVVLHDNGLASGDTIVGAFYQSNPVVAGGRPVFYWRAELNGIVPTGGFDSSKAIDQGSGFGSLNPYLAFTYLPTPRLEIGGRANYLYNFATRKAAAPASLPGLPFREGQAGQAAWLNFDASYEVAPGFSLGANGYWLTQLTDDAYNGLDVPHSKAEALYIGPGFHWVVSPHNILSIKYYTPVNGRNLAQGAKFGLQYIHPF